MFKINSVLLQFDFVNEVILKFLCFTFQYKERDYLEGIFKFWREEDARQFNVSAMWNNRLRQYLGTRYDTRMGAFDWDLSMKLGDLGVSMY